MSLFMRLFAQPDPPHNLIASNPRLERLRSSRAFMLLVMMIFILPIFLMFIIFVIFAIIVKSEITPFPWIFLLIMMAPLLNIGFFSVLIHYWKRIETWRFAAALGDDRLLANEQPQPNPDALQMPVTIRMSPIVERRFVVGYLSLCVFLLMIWIIRLLFPIFPWFWSLLIAVLVGGLLTLGFVPLVRIRQPIEVSQEGIKFQAANKIFSFMFWYEVRLFACYPEPGSRNNSPAMIYELSSASHVVYWTWIQRKSPLDVIVGTILPFEEHNAQMRAFCALVAAKTGLPLYDLSKGQTLKLEKRTTKTNM